MHIFSGILRKESIPILLLLLSLITSCGQTDIQTEIDPPVSPLPTAVVYLNQGDFDAAEKIWRQTMELDPTNAEAHYQLGLLLILGGNEDAVSHLENAEILSPQYAPSVSRLKTALRQSKTIEDPAYQLTILGQAFASLEEWHLAESALEQAVADNPEYAEAWAYLGETRQHTGNGDALFALQHAHSLNPKSFAANLFLSIYYRRTEEPLAAIEYLETAMLSDPENQDLQADLAQTLIEAGGISKGFQILEDSAEESPDDAESWLRLARLSIDNNLQVTESGLPAARQALLLAPDLPEAALLLGRGYLFLGNKVLAERFLNQALQMDDQLPEAHYYLGILYLNSGERSQARTHLLTANRLAHQTNDRILITQIENILNEYFEN